MNEEENYIFIEDNRSPLRGRNITITLFKMDGGALNKVSESHENTASYRGSRAIASRLLAEHLETSEIPFSFDGYTLKAEGMTLREIDSGCNVVCKFSPDEEAGMSL